jgi:hypothetical protein
VNFRKVVRRVKDGNGVSAVNAVVASSVGEPGGTVGSTSTQHVEITQHNGHTEVRKHHSTDKEI